MSTAQPKRNIWRSQRLSYRAIEETDEPFLLSFNAETTDTFQNATHRLPVPRSRANARSHRESIQNALLGCIISITSPQPGSASDSAAASAAPTEPIPIGIIVLMHQDPERTHHRNTAIAVTIAPAFQGKGYGSEAILWVLEWAFRWANIHRVEIGAFAWNEGAVKLYQRLGFVLEGRKREAVWYDGKYCDEIVMGMLEGEWRERYGRVVENGVKE